MVADRVTPERFIAWAHEVGLAFHSDWHRAGDQSASQEAPSGAAQSKTDQKRNRLITSWARSPYWSPEEGAVLAFDLDPSEAIEHTATGYEPPSLKAPADARQLAALAHRAMEVDDLKAKPKPVEFMRWARSTGREFHADWWGAVVDEAAHEEDQTGATEPAAPALELKTREQESLLKMVAGMAIAGYRWDPDKPRNDATAEIASDLERLGVPLDPETIRKWLRRGAALVPKADR